MTAVKKPDAKLFFKFLDLQAQGRSSQIQALGSPISAIGISPQSDLVRLVGLIQASSVTIRQVPGYIRVFLSQFRLEYYTGGQLQKTFRVAVGAPSTPTPVGHFYVWASEDYGAPYTPGIFALSAFSPVLENWPGGGRTGIHGWTDTSVLGRAASHGCVRMAPSDFAQLLHTVPLGTPVDLLA